MKWICEIDGVSIVVEAPGKTEVPEHELRAYVARGREKCGRMLRGIKLVIDGDEVAIDYTMLGKPFERIRRITGYLVGGTQRFNDGKRAEERDRVKHGTEAPNE